MNVFSMCSICSYHLYDFQWKFFDYMSPFNSLCKIDSIDVIDVHFKCFKLKPKLKIGSNEFVF